MKPLILFDLDGTLTDPAEGITRCIQHALRAEGVRPPPREELVVFIGPPLQETFALLLRTDDPTVVERATAKYRERFVEIGMFENRVYEGIPQVLAGLRKSGFDLAVATSKPHLYARKILEHFELNDFFTAVFGPELDGTRRDKGELIAHALATLGTGAHHCLMVGDREHDIIGARANAMRALAVKWGYGADEEHTAAGAFAHVSSVSDLHNACLGAHPSAP